jgi:hypothetical protein
MTETIEPMTAQIDQQQLAQELVEQARTEGVELVGQGGLLTRLAKSVLEAALEAEMTEHVRLCYWRCTYGVSPRERALRLGVLGRGTRWPRGRGWPHQLGTSMP